jgi:hypothetical protein
MILPMDQQEKSLAAAESRKAERRAHVRRACEGEVTSSVVGAPHSSSWSAQIRNISEGGLGLFMASPLAAGTILSVEMRLRDQPRNLRVEVVHCTVEEAGWLVGCRFLSAILEPEMVEWLSSSQ